MSASDEDVPSWSLMPPEALLALGKVTASYSMLEAMLHQFVWMLADTDGLAGSILTSRLNVTQLRERLSGLYRHRTAGSARHAEHARVVDLLSASTSSRCAGMISCTPGG